MPFDLYGNEVQQDTPTTMLIASRKQKAEPEPHFKIGVKVYPNLTKDAVVAGLRKLAEVVEGTTVERFRFEILIEEVKKE
jgi:hypothetical protein